VETGPTPSQRARHCVGDARLKALISGQAAAAIVLARHPQLRKLDEEPQSGPDLAEMLRIFDGCHDIQEVDIASVDEVDRLTEQAWEADRGLKLFLLLLDPAEPREALAEYAECIEEVLPSDNVRTAIRNRLHAASLPGLVEIVRVEEACAAAPRTLALFLEVISAQKSIEAVCATYGRVHARQFESEYDKQRVREALIDSGAFAALASALRKEESLDFLKLQLSSKHLAYSQAINQWIAMLQPGLAKIPKSLRSLTSEVDDDHNDLEMPVGQSYAAYEQVRAQQRAIVEKLKVRDLAAAQRLTHHLIESQKVNSTPEQIAKSLSSLAQQAKREEVPELQREWALWATEVNPHDPRTFGHLADALIGLGRFQEAGVILEKLEAAGGAAFAASSRARILRAMGKPQEAREAYLGVLERFPDDEGAVYASIGAAESLRDMGANEDAQAEYRRITERWPLEAAGWAGLASVMMDMGRFDEAIHTFGRAGSGDRIGLVKGGRATAYKLAGNLDAALALYDEVVAEFPNHHVGLCGRAEVLRALGNYPEALKSYDTARERSPYSVVPISGKAGVLREMGRPHDALALYEQGIREFPYDPQLRQGRAGALRSLGQYSEALAAYDEAIQAFPFTVGARVARASVLHRLGATQDALAAYDDVLAERPYSLAPLTAKAALLVSLDRFEDARALLPDTRPRSQFEWRRFMVRALWVEGVEGPGVAARLLERGISSCPFAKERRWMRSALASLELRRKRFRDARRIVEAAPTEVSAVIALHVFAASHRAGLAAKRLQEISAGQGSAVVIELANEIARRHRLLSGEPQHSLSWITRLERDLLLAEAA